MENELQKENQGKVLETEEKVVNTLPELAAVSENIKGDKVVKREVGVVLNDGNNENIDTVTDNNRENESEKDEYSSNKKLDIGGSVEKQVIELDDDNDQIKSVSNTTLSLTGSKEKIAENITIDNVSISKTTEKSNLDDEIVETVQVDKTVVNSPFEKTIFESTSKIENNSNEPTVKSLETDKITVQNLDTKEITSTNTVTSKKEVIEVSPDQTLTENITFEEKKDKISKEMDVQSIEVKKTSENDVKDQKNIESTTRQETITETPVDKTTVTLVVNENSIINKVTFVDPDDSNNEDLVITREDSGGKSDKSNIDVVSITEIREEKPQFDDNDDEDLETPTPATPESVEDLITTISKLAPELVPVVRDLKEVSDKLDPIKRSWNDLKLRNKSVEYSIKTETDHDIKSEEEKLVQKAIDSIKEAMIEGAETENRNVDQEGKVILPNSQIQTLLQPTSSSPSSIVADVMESMVTPGFNNNVVLAMNICFWLLFTSLIFLAVLSDYDYMVLLNLGISVLLYISLCWFIIVTRASQVEEAAKIAKKED